MSIKDTRYRLPDELLDNMYSLYSPGLVDSILRAFEARRNTTLRMNSLKTNEHVILEEFSQNHIKYSKCNWYKHAVVLKDVNEGFMSKLTSYVNGHIYLQSLSSMLPPLYMELAPNLKVLDMAAAPGGKTTQMAAMMNNVGSILANEINEVRAERLRYNVAKQGAECIEVRVGDGRDLGDIYPEQFDRVLLDAPCGGEGIINMHDTLSFSKWSAQNIKKNAKLQRQLLESGRKALKKGGVLIYSTCTISAEENEEVIDWFVKTYKDMKLKSININISNCHRGVTTYKGKVFHEELKKALRIIPSSEMEGFFICKLTKV